MSKSYLGDSVYVHLDEDTGTVVLTTENGLPDDPSNEIYMEPDVLRSFQAWIKQEAGLLPIEKNGKHDMMIALMTMKED